MKVLETDRLILRNYKETDFDDYWEFASQPNVGPMAGWPPHTDKNNTRERLELEISKPNQFAIVVKDENKVIGSIEIMDCKTERYIGNEFEPGCKEIGMVLSEYYWNKGYATEALNEIMRYSFNELNIPSIFICHAKANIGSGKVQDKCGFKVIGEYPNYRTWIDGTDTSCIMRKMTQEEYFELQRNESRK